MIEIIPVIDIKKGKAVRAYKGERETYSEIGDVLDIAGKYCANKFSRIYIADLDAIMHNFKSENFDLIRKISINNKVHLIVDFGIKSIEEYMVIKKAAKTIAKNTDLIVGTETYLSDKFPDDAIISIDAVDGKILGRNFEEVVRFLKSNTNPFITIDLKHIGTSDVNAKLCTEIFKATKRKFIYGGGVRTNNIYKLEQYCRGVIIGTEIYEKLNLI
ncbi:MAG: hypothetical protein GW779_04690 [Candidatus Altiarchaeum hamiconexum]|uniref:1-(5-phosphoribosyl)-5-[(5-phosphoribosylamino)methylideneamino] imidazole-4-carboxamide isomerase n=1 Tax=Candidatus Altarchaeum hamiconexum TaxID=1803513 RepID=A0A8J7YT16_9ARCH|nr:hypothetical protein [Candidatus Altarchaeum hamiconexum]OIQ04706.1 MAG: hypothetical protein AUK59_06695 [Candidatus Altarchaeum sp. CG2_30_32_3053]PIV28339.1 MAG: hypothetical protein COS36_02570 [Candidatus Altarchaeum sp. CG03_land_8_20_14_0_80_32_618]PIX48731.1 MAG: hypothetical protein COZ53_03055 [Candidatus Altarchaeum sp. CG_4_8_14_3_um_filter_33_2054]PIZ32620.1 MAG: hypothetical protein COY41_00795 [Candidatus Altarchaeum sp. CG_4_10_14_0_8_um_filter_32_851]